MKTIFAFGLVVAVGSTVIAQTVNVRGKVSNAAGMPVANAVLELAQQGAKDTTGSDGMYSITKTGSPIRLDAAMPTEYIRLDKGVLELTVSKPSLVKVEVFDVNGNIQKKESLPKAQPGVYHLKIAAPLHSNGMLIVQASIGPLVRTFRYFPSQKDIAEGNFSVASPRSAGGTLAKIAAAVDTLEVSGEGYAMKKIVLDSYDTTLNITLDTVSTGGVPKVTAQNATTVPDMYKNAVANPGKLTKDVTYQAYWYSTSAASSEAFKQTPTITKQTTPKSKFFHIYTPPGYDPQKQYPLIIALHGITDNPNMWFDRVKVIPIVNMLDNLITSKATKPFIAVFASGTVDNSTNAYYAFGGELMNDLLPAIESKYSVKKDRGSRAMAGFSFGGMQTLSIGLCAHLKEFAWFAGLDAAGPPVPDATTIAKYVAEQEPLKYPVYYLYLGAGKNDSGSGASSANGLATKGPYITAANFTWHNNIVGTGNGAHNYETAQVGLYNFLQMAFSPNY
ncbi:MAG: alpha/beta hydrolase-fold protein [Fibrobacteria bacterium]